MDLSQEDEIALIGIRKRDAAIGDMGTPRYGDVAIRRLLRLYDTLRRKVEVLERVASICETCGADPTVPCCSQCNSLGAVSKHAERPYGQFVRALIDENKELKTHVALLERTRDVMMTDMAELRRLAGVDR